MVSRRLNEIFKKGIDDLEKDINSAQDHHKKVTADINKKKERLKRRSQNRSIIQNKWRQD